MSLTSRQKIISIISSSIGNVLEWYEYTLYAYFATVIRDLFFPIHNPTVATMMTFATFAVGLAARPIGGIIFGYIGDKVSRKKMLAITMLLMSFPTLCMGMLPTYQQIGMAAPAILITLRILQGIALGGEFGASCVYLYESVDQKRRGFFGSLALTGVGLGLVLSSCTIFIVESYATKRQIYEFAWRIPFFISVFGAIIGFYMRSILLETGDFIEAKATKKLVQNPFMTLMRNHKITLLKLFAIFLTTQTAFFIIFIFGKTMMMDYIGFSSYLAGKIILFSVTSYTISTLIFGYLSDVFNKRYMIIFGAFSFMLLAYPYITTLLSGNQENILIISILMGSIMALTEGTMNPLVAESFPTNIRATSVAFCWNFTSVAFGGSSPLIAMWLLDSDYGPYGIAYCLIFVCIISISVTLWSLIRDDI